MRDMAHHPERAPQAIPTKPKRSEDLQRNRFQSLTGPTSHSNPVVSTRSGSLACVSIPNGPHKPFQHSFHPVSWVKYFWFQSLTGPTSHSTFSTVSLLKTPQMVSIPN